MRRQRPKRWPWRAAERAVTYPNEQIAALTKWPRYGDAEKKALYDLLDNNKFYEELPAFEKEWKDYTRSPFVKTHINGTSALTSMYFALDLPAGSEIMVPSYTFFATCLAMRFFGYVPIFIDIDPKTARFDLEDAKRKLTPQDQGRGADALVGPAVRDGPHQRLGQGEGADRARRRRPRARRVHAGQEDGHLGRDGHLQLPGHQGHAVHRRRHGHVPDARVFRARRGLRRVQGPGQVPQGQPGPRLRRHRLRPEIPHAPVGGRAGPPAAEGTGRAQRARGEERAGDERPA